MDILGITTSSPEGSVSLFSKGVFFQKKFHSSVMSHSSLLLPAINAVCADGGISLKDIKQVCVDTGPGSFTGIRLALACVSAFSLSLEFGLTGISSLDIMAEGVCAMISGVKKDKEFFIIIDAGRNEFYGAEYQYDASCGLEQKSEEALCREEDLLADSNINSFYGYFHRRSVSPLKKKCQIFYPDSENLIKSALKRKNGEKEEFRPNYIRSPHVIMKKRN